MKLKTEMLLSIVAVLVSVAALVTTWFESSASRKHDRLSVKPIVSIAFKVTGQKGQNGFFIANNGLGPAVIKKLMLYWDSKRIDQPDEKAWAYVFDKMGIDGSCMKKALISGAVLKPGEEHIIVGKTDAAVIPCDIAFSNFYLLEKKSFHRDHV